MDPNAAWNAIRSAIEDARWTEANELADGLLDWLVKGGFPPKITGVQPFDRIVAKVTCEAFCGWDLCD